MKFFFFLLLVLMTGLVSLRAETVTPPGETISINVPDSWDQTSPPNMLIAAHAGTYLMQVVKSPNPRNLDLNSSVIEGIKSGMERMAESNGATLNFGDESALMMSGAPAYLIHASQTRGSTTAQISLYVIDANKALYLIYLVTTGSMPDTTLQGIADSFRFTSPPSQPESTFDRRAYKLGILAGVLLVLLLIGGGIWYAVRRSRD